MKFKQRRRRIGFYALSALAARRADRGMAAVAATGERLGVWHHRLAVAMRRRLRHQLAHLFEYSADDPRLAAWLAEAYRINDRAIFEILAMYSGRASIDDVAAHCRINGLPVLDQALAEGRGVVLLGWHMGNGVAMATRLAHLGYPVAVVFRESAKIRPDFYPNGLKHMGLEAIGATPAAAGFRRMLKALKANRILFILMDQGISQGVPTRFLKKRVPMPPGPAELARRTDCALITAGLSAVEPTWTFDLHREAALNADEPLEASVAKLSAIMENQIRERPEWWTWHQRRWPKYPFDESLEPPAAPASGAANEDL
jgi:KDO2-lipid IV(A) lauroyltransferase